MVSVLTTEPQGTERVLQVGRQEICKAQIRAVKGSASHTYWLKGRQAEVVSGPVQFCVSSPMAKMSTLIHEKGTEQQPLETKQDRHRKACSK